MSDPLWFHDFTYDKHYVFKDKRGVYNGLRCPLLNPADSWEDHDGACPCNEKNPLECQFLKKYKNRLDAIDFDDFMKRLNRLINKIVADEQMEEEPVVVFIVYETPKNKCSERQTIINWFNSHGIPAQELTYPIKS